VAFSTWYTRTASWGLWSRTRVLNCGRSYRPGEASPDPPEMLHSVVVDPACIFHRRVPVAYEQRDHQQSASRSKQSLRLQKEFDVVLAFEVLERVVERDLRRAAPDVRPWIPFFKW